MAGAGTNVAICVVTVILMCRSVHVHAACNTTDKSTTNIMCSDMSESQFINETKLYKDNNITSLTTYGVNITNLPVIEKWTENMSKIKITRNNEIMNTSIIQNFKQLCNFDVSGSYTSKEFNGFYVTSVRQELILKFQDNNINKITSVCQGDYYPRWSLDLTYNKIDSFTKTDIGNSNCTSKLWKLNLKYNHLTSFNADVFLQLSGLEWIDISYNKISTFDNNLNNLSSVIQVKELYLGYNNISKLKDESFKYLNKLEILNLTNNILTTLDPKIFSNLVLQQLDISGNSLVNFELHTVKPNLTALEDLYLIGNQWDCTALKQLLTYLKAKNISYSQHSESNNNVSNVDGINCISSIVLNHLSFLQENIQNEYSKNISLLKDNLTSVSQSLHNYKVKILEHRYNASNLTKDLEKSLRKNDQFAVILVVIVIFNIMLCLGVVWLGLYVRYRSSGGAAGESADKREPVIREEPLYHYVELSGVQQSRESCIYEEPPNIPTTAIRVASVCSEHALYSVCHDENTTVPLPLAKEMTSSTTENQVASSRSEDALYSVCYDDNTTDPSANEMTSSTNENQVASCQCSEHALYSVCYDENTTVPLSNEMTLSTIENQVASICSENALYSVCHEDNTTVPLPNEMTSSTTENQVATICSENALYSVCHDENITVPLPNETTSSTTENQAASMNRENSLYVVSEMPVQ